MLAAGKAETLRAIPSRSLSQRGESCRNRLLTSWTGLRSTARNPLETRRKKPAVAPMQPPSEGPPAEADTSLPPGDRAGHDLDALALEPANDEALRCLVHLHTRCVCLQWR
jgi:hypothetical protein